MMPPTGVDDNSMSGFNSILNMVESGPKSEKMRIIIKLQ